MKYNGPIYFKLEKLDITVHLASQANTAQILAELEEDVTEADADFALCAKLYRPLDGVPSKWRNLQNFV